MEVTLLFLSLILTPPQSTHKHYECTLEIEEITPLDNHHQKCMGGKLIEKKNGSNSHVFLFFDHLFFSVSS